MVTYNLATLNNQTIHISEVTEDLRNNNDFYCAECGNKMAAHLKDSRAIHFHHINYIEHDHETYLHKVAKKVLKETYERCLKENTPYQILYQYKRICFQRFKVTGIKCDVGIDTDYYDLTKKFPRIEEETRSNSLVPDLKLIDPVTNEQIFIEIFVSHKSTEEKLHAGYRIIEIKIQSEQDILELKNPLLSTRNSRVKFYNFAIKERHVDYCSHREYGCRNLLEFFVLYHDGKYEFSEQYLEQIIGVLLYEPLYYEIDPFKDMVGIKKPDEKLDILIKKVRSMGYKMKVCSLCKYHGVNYRKKSNEPLFCKFMRKPVNPDAACYCDYFRIQEEPKKLNTDANKL